ncbi:MAG: type II toxin-antitoxin system Phd/YefM family antitoxin [Microcystis aeruginosa LL11-07]|nr:type II toxin-antitoxin system Phd/YefM family antitoxin [Microcystis aeruginosa LL11-07]
MSVNIVNFSEARKNFKSVIDTVANDKNCTFIVRGDTEDVVIMSKTYYDSLMETVYLLKSQGNRTSFCIKCNRQR